MNKKHNFRLILGKISLIGCLLFLPYVLVSQTNEEILDKANHAYNNGDFELADKLFNQFLLEDTTNADVFYHLGVIKSLDFLFGGFEEFNKAIQLDSNHVGALMARGNYYSYTSEDKLALLDYTRAHSLEPGNMGVLYNLAGAKRVNGDIDGALQSYTELIEMDGYNKAHALAERGSIYLKMKEYERAIHDLEAAIHGGYDFCLTYEDLGDAYFQMKDIESACQSWNKGTNTNDYEFNCQSLSKKIKKNCQ